MTTPWFDVRSRWTATHGRWLSGVLMGLLWLWGVAGSMAWAQVPDAVVIDRARLVTSTADIGVDLPYRLKRGEFAAEGEMVRFVMTLELSAPPEQALGVYVPKMSLSGALSVNGHWVGNCGAESLASSRCLHRPHLFTPPLNLLRQGSNELEISVWVNDQQMNGLSQVRVGNALTLHHQNLAPGLFWRVSVIQALMWVSVGLGLIALGIAAVLRQTPTYLWFGLCCLAYAVSCVNELVVNFPNDPRLLSWVIFSSRLMTVPLLILTFLTVVPDRLSWLKKTLVLFAVMAPVLIALSENSRIVVMLLYVPLMGLSIFVTGYLLHTSGRTGSVRALLSGLGLMIFVGVGITDWLRLSGQTAFEGVLLGSYAFGGLLLAVGGFLSITLAEALRISRTFGERLEGEVQKRTMQIEQLNRELTLLEVERTRVQVREKLIQDMHDGFGSQLATASIMAKTSKLSAAEMGQLLDDCLTDLQLVVDTHLASSHNLCDVLFDFKHRLLQRLGNTKLQLQFDIEVPEGVWLSQDKTLQFLRVLQEAVSNALRHAGAQRLHIGVLLKPQDQRLEAFVRDDGQGLNAANKAGRGINTMKARVRELGGDIQMLSGRGLSVTIWVPTMSSESSASA
jgi:signal transduction histidine kinase